MDENPGTDSELTQVAEILRGVKRGKRDPDVKLFELLVGLDWRSRADVESSLKSLLRDEDTD